MDAIELLRSGSLQDTFATVKEQVRKAPREARLRVFLFQLFCISGEWERAVNQLTVLGELDPLAMPMVTTYKAAIRCELLRARVFAGTATPTIFGKPAAWISHLLEANRLLGTGHPGEAAQMRDLAFEEAPATSGKADGQEFAWIADADPRLGPVLEAIVEGKYYWVPLTRVKRITVEPPVDLRDKVWLPVHFEWTNKGEVVGFIPTRYPGSESAGEDTLALSHKTEWREQGDWFLGLGQRMLATDVAEIALMDLRKLELDTSDEPEAAANDG